MSDHKLIIKSFGRNIFEKKIKGKKDLEDALNDLRSKMF